MELLVLLQQMHRTYSFMTYDQDKSNPIWELDLAESH
ncbi:unnamed protein product [Brassica oleracea]